MRINYFLSVLDQNHSITDYTFHLFWNQSIKVRKCNEVTAAAKENMDLK